ncbi:MAG: signal recognition particle-docking protein FtsY [Chloroflexi bacterium]|nr:signal recognition particle-docking protein FtsY [Chloroflexota bacterium]
MRFVFARLRSLVTGLERSRESVFGGVAALFDRPTIDDGLWDELEERLIAGDVGVDLVEDLVGRVRDQVRAEGIREGVAAQGILKREMVRVLRRRETEPPVHGGLRVRPGLLTVILVVGVNGAGKTTSIAKLAHYLKGMGRRVVIAAADTFRAAAIEQLKLWGERAQVPVIAHADGADPGAVVFDAWQHARAVQADILLIDTAGRLHTRFNLMEELRKVRRVLEKHDAAAPHEVLLVLDATIGQNALAQAREFQKIVGVTGLILAKLDSSARGGAIFAIAEDLGLPIRFVGTGERIEALEVFDPEEFVEGLFLKAERAA